MLASKGKLGLLQLPSLELEVGSLFTDTHEVAGYMFDVKEYLLPLFVFFLRRGSYGRPSRISSFGRHFVNVHE